MLPRTLIALLAAAFLASAQPSANYSVLWEREFGAFSDVFFLQGVGVDGHGDLWVLTSAFTGSRDYTRRTTLFRIDGSGDQQSAVDVEAHVPANVKTDLAEYYPVVLPDGPAGFLVAVHRVRVRDSESLGAFYAPLLKPGAVGSPVRISAPDGPIFWRVAPLADRNLLVVGDQDPLVVEKISPNGEVRWRRRFWKWLDGPSAAAMEDGKSCVVAGEYPRPTATQQLHLLRLDAVGALERETKLRGYVATVAAGPNGACAVFGYDFPPGMDAAHYHLTAFDTNFKREWTRDIPPDIAGPIGMEWYLVALRDGYLAAGVTWGNDLFLARYSWAGDLLWLEKLKAPYGTAFLASNPDGFYLVSEIDHPLGPPTSFRVMKIAVLR